MTSNRHPARTGLTYPTYGDMRPVSTLVTTFLFCAGADSKAGTAGFWDRSYVPTRTYLRFFRDIIPDIASAPTQPRTWCLDVPAAAISHASRCCGTLQNAHGDVTSSRRRQPRIKWPRLLPRAPGGGRDSATEVLCRRRVLLEVVTVPAPLTRSPASRTRAIAARLP